MGLDWTINEDKIIRPGVTGPAYNALLSSKDVSDDSGIITEPVSLLEMRNYLRIQAYNSGSGTLTFDDALITDMISAARQMLEERLSISIIFHTWEIALTNLAGRSEIPYGPVIKIWSVSDNTGAAQTYLTEGNLFLFLVSPCARDIRLRYDAGYNNPATEQLPKGIKIDIMRLVTYMYLSRGDETKVEVFVSRLASKYNRNTLFI